VIKNISKMIVGKKFGTPKLKLDTVNSAKIGKMTEIGHTGILVIKYIRILFKSDQMFQKSFLSGIEVDSIA
jgi:hypothetical protein